MRELNTSCVVMYLVCWHEHPAGSQGSHVYTDRAPGTPNIVHTETEPNEPLCMGVTRFA